MLTNGIYEGSPDVEGTTLIKPVPYETMDRDESDVILECIKNKKYNDPDLFYSTDYQNNLKHYKLVGFHSGESDAKVGPVFHVHSITIFNDRPDWNASKLHGAISITDDRGTVGPFSVYQRGIDDPEEVSTLHNVLTLAQTPMAPLVRAKFTFNLFGISEDARIFSKTCFGEYKTMDYNDDYTKPKVNQLLVTGKYGYYARVSYSITPFALIADIRMRFQLHKLPISVFDTFGVGGTIKVNDLQLLKNKQLEFSVNDRKEYISRVELTRKAIPVPIPSTLYFELSITKDGTEFVTDMATIHPLGFKQAYWHCKCKDEDKGCYFHIFVSWTSPDDFFGLLPKITRPLTSQDADNYVEVFSVFIGGGGSTPTPIRGSIVVSDRDDTVYIFYRNEKCPYKLRWYRRTVALAWPSDRWILEKKLYMHMKLKDVRGNPLCRGGLCWFNDDSDLRPRRFDRRMRAVIRGEGGYFAAVHYSIFRNCLRAKVTLNVDCETPFDLLDVYGVVCAEYNNYDYSSMYDREYNRVIIFKRNVEERVKVQNSSSLPLSKSLITAPSDCVKLYIDVSISVRPFIGDAPVFDADLEAMGKIRYCAGISASQQIHVLHKDSGVRLGVLTMKVEWVK